MTEEDEKSETSGGSLCFILLVLNIIIKSNTSPELFSQIIPHGDYFSEFHDYMIGCSAALWLSLLLVMWLSCYSITVNCDPTKFVLIPLITMLITTILQYWQMGRIWHVAPKHTLFFYNPFWTEGLCNFSQNTTDTLPIQLNETGKVYSSETDDISNVVQWPYVMSDVIVRIYSFCLMLIPVIAGILFGCYGSAACCGWLTDKICGGNNKNSKKQFTGDTHPKHPL